MKLRLNSKRSRVVDFAATINLVIGARDAYIRIKQCTGPLTLNILDPTAVDGDNFILAVASDASPRTITLGGAQGAPGSIVLGANASGAYSLHFHGGAGKYFATAVPT